MVDVNVDRILKIQERKKEWKEETKLLIKNCSYKTMLEEFIKASEEYNEKYYNKNKPYNKTGFNIIKIADDYGLEPKGKRNRICPFHVDKNPSLSLSKDKECFNCFGCGVKGDIITFVKLLEELKNGKK